MRRLETQEYRPYLRNIDTLCYQGPFAFSIDDSLSQLHVATVTKKKKRLILNHAKSALSSLTYEWHVMLCKIGETLLQM